jgi:hypothetical protein
MMRLSPLPPPAVTHGDPAGSTDAGDLDAVDADAGVVAAGTVASDVDASDPDLDPDNLTAAGSGRPLPRQRVPHRSPIPGRAARSPGNSRTPWLAVPAVLLLVLLASFFGWVSAEPFWLSVGHGRSGTVTVLAAQSTCRGSFAATESTFVLSTVDIIGLAADDCRPGVALAARMVSPDATHAYAVDSGGLALRWGVGFGLVLLCGVAIARITGAFRFAGWRRLVATVASIVAPFAIVATQLALAY